MITEDQSGDDHPAPDRASRGDAATLSNPTEPDAAKQGRELEAPDHLDRDPGDRTAPTKARRARWWVPLLTAVLGIALGLGIGLSLGGQWWQPQPTVIGSATLKATTEWSTSSGTATVEVTPQGERYVIVRIATPPPRDGYRQVWLVSKDGIGYYPLGAVVGDERRFPLPPGLDLNVYPTVEVTYQVIDGEPSHSGDKMLYGSLE